MGRKIQIWRKAFGKGDLTGDRKILSSGRSAQGAEVVEKQVFYQA